MVATTLGTATAFEIEVPPAAVGERLDRYLASLRSGDAPELSGAGLSRARWQQLIDQGDVLLDGRVVRAAYRLRGGEQLALRLPAPTPLGLVAEVMDLDVLYEDADLVVLNKPAGLSVHPGAGRACGTLVNALLAHCHDLSGIGGELRPGIVHRLDRGTSGAIVVAKNDAAHLGLSRQFARREVHKSYVAFVLGSPVPSSGTFDTFYGRHPTHRRRFTSRLKTGRRAVTHYRVRLVAGGVALLDVRLETGRTHQIRVHLSEHGHPIVGDPLYGGTRLERVQSPLLRDIASQISYQALHAARLEFLHPLSGERLVCEAPLPPALNALWEAMRRLA
ncbi:MAG: RluA family pseudouridine synthase [Myxococcota bacterium]